MNKKKTAAIALMAVGLVAVILSFCVIGLDTGKSESDSAYGGDAYTGIQNAAAQTARNLVELASAVTMVGFSILLISGLAMIAGGLYLLPDSNAGNFYDPYGGGANMGVPGVNPAGGTTWTCSCGRVNADYVMVCPCGAPKFQPAVNPNPMAGAPAPGVAPGGWRCYCGKEHPAYVSSCSCGINKTDVRM